MGEKRATEERDRNARLVRQSIQGDAQAYGELVRAHSKRAYSIAYSVLGDFQAAQDVAQEAFVRGYSKLDSLKDPEKFVGWIDTITRNLARRALQQRRRESVLLTDFSDPANHPAAPERTQALNLQEAINSLPETYREPLVMRYITGATYEEIGAMLGMSRNTAEVRIHRAKKMLTENMAKARKN
jgi:RNA polymerase sigma-70 factor (ECF subfamily)